jgi:hypothetical protein
MPLTPNFTAVESLAFPSQITLTDTSTGSDGTVTGRVAYFRLADGTYLTPTGISNSALAWPIAQTSIVFDLLPRSHAVSITVNWLAGSTVAYTLTTLWDFDLYDYLEGYAKVQNLTSSPKLFDDVNFFLSVVRLDANIFMSEVAVTIGNDIYSAQERLDDNYSIIQHQIVYF